jgi:hypothetical protein
VFPVPPNEVKITKPPMISYDSKSKTYVVTAEFVRRSVEQELYLRRVIDWKHINQIE